LQYIAAKMMQHAARCHAARQYKVSGVNEPRLVRLLYCTASTLDISSFLGRMYTNFQNSFSVGFPTKCCKDL